MALVQDFCRKVVVVARPSEPLLAVLGRMRAQRTDTAVVVADAPNGDLTPRGVLSDRDIVAHLFRDCSSDLSSLRAEQVISTKLDVAFEDADLLRTIGLMRAADLQAIPVVNDDGVLTGLLHLEDSLDYLSLLTRALELLVVRERRTNAILEPS